MPYCMHGFPLFPRAISSITSGKSSRLHPVSVQSCYRLALSGCPTLVRLCEEVHMSLSLLLYQCSACLVCLIWMVFEMGC